MQVNRPPAAKRPRRLPLAVLDWRSTLLDASVEVLANGLTVVAHRDDRTPVVAVYIAYRAGSRDETAGRNGLAHLFEHLMFLGSAHQREQYFLPFERIGASSMNATVKDDYTAYFTTVPAAALDFALWMEAERMGCLIDALDQGRFERQREVVRNELHQRESEPYGRVARIIRRHAYPREHPYAHLPNGLVEDLANLTLLDVTNWFTAFYGASNAVVIVTGDVEPDHAIARARHYFEPLSSGEAISRPARWVARMDDERRYVLADERARNRLYRVWNVPGFGTPEHPAFALACEILAGGESSRLFRRLVQEIRVAAEVSAELEARELGSQMIVRATAAPGVRLEALDSAIRVEFGRFTERGPSAAETAASRRRILARFIRGIERISGPGGKAETLAVGAAIGGDPNAVAKLFEQMASLTEREIADSVQLWLGGASFTLEVHKASTVKATSRRGDHGASPAVNLDDNFLFPERSKAQLRNGLPLIAVERRGSMLTECRLVVEGGFAADGPYGSGFAAAAMAMLGHAVWERRRPSIRRELERLGATVRATVKADACVIELSTLASNLQASLRIFARILLEADFDRAMLDAVKAGLITAVTQERSRPFDLALRRLPRMIFGDNHPYARPFTGSGTESGIADVTIEELRAFFAERIRPDRSTLIVVGAVGLDTLVTQLERALARWCSSAGYNRRAWNLVHAIWPLASSYERIVLVDEPGRVQPVIFAALPTLPANDPAIEALTLADVVLGGAFGSRLNLNLREEKAWTYGVRSSLIHTRATGIWLVHSFVRADMTAAAMREIRNQWRGLANEQPIGPDELSNAQNHLIMRLPAGFETNSQIADSLQETIIFGLPDDYYCGLGARLRQLRVDDITAVCRQIIGESGLAWLVIGDAASLARQIRQSGFGEPEIVGAGKRHV